MVSDYMNENVIFVMNISHAATLFFLLKDDSKVEKLNECIDR